MFVRVRLVNEPTAGGAGFVSSQFWPAAAAIWTASVLALALSPHMEQGWLMKTFGDKALHGAAFTVGAVTWIRTIERSPRFSQWGAIAAGSGAALIIGIAIEIFQEYIPGRSADIRDFASDVAGVLLAWLILRFFPNGRSRMDA